MMRRVALVPVGLALMLGAAACGGYGGGGSGGSSTTSTSASTSGKTELVMHDYYFQPKTVQGKAGQKVTLELKNEGNTLHNFTLSAQGVNQDVQAGEQAEVTVTIPQSGMLSFYCKYHRSSGMTGALQASSSRY